VQEHTRLQKYLREKDRDASSVIRKALVTSLDQEQQGGEKEKADRV
jgi:Arc/MetJ-type ribon-helix-helix transcriptional regulator